MLIIANIGKMSKIHSNGKCDDGKKHKRAPTNEILKRIGGIVDYTGNVIRCKTDSDGKIWDRSTSKVD